VFADRRTVFGDLPTETEELAPGYRSHGSLYERYVPLIRWGVRGLPTVETTMNWHLLRPLADGDDVRTR
jgi:hypothetical protein